MKTDLPSTSTKEVYYCKGYKYQLAVTLVIQTPFRPKWNHESPFLKLFNNGQLYIAHGYASDGPSGPTIDTPEGMRGGFTHDALYQLIRLNIINENDRKICDKLFYQLLREDDMNWFRAKYWYYGVRWKGGSSAIPGNTKKVHCAPRRSK